ncbi:hypothetical protein F4604DRAFT_1684397 [Suillus subluteus]|nr:hypothetical protein F4604DRAFT_1684397 [Suillus subluteus]
MTDMGRCLGPSDVGIFPMDMKATFRTDALDGSDVAIEAVLQHIADGGSQDPPAGYSVDDNGSLITHNEAEVYKSEVAGHAQVAEALNMGKGGEENKEIPGFGRGQRRRTANTLYNDFWSH